MISWWWLLIMSGVWCALIAISFGVGFYLGYKEGFRTPRG